MTLESRQRQACRYMEGKRDAYAAVLAHFRARGIDDAIKHAEEGISKLDTMLQKWDCFEEG
jgi:hypothetical protein